MNFFVRFILALLAMVAVYAVGALLGIDPSFSEIFLVIVAASVGSAIMGERP